MQSYHRKVNILHELDQAIKRKVQQRSKEPKDINPKHLQSNDKKSSSFVPSQRNKSLIDRQPPSNRTKSPRQSTNKPYQPTPSTQFLKLTQQLSQKRFGNRKMDKLVGLINYVLSSADKVMRHININNFEAEFSVKLFLSDKETLLSELENLKLEELGNGGGSQSRSTMKNRDNQKSNVLIVENHSLRAENSEYRKEMMLLQAEIKRVKEERLQLQNELRVIRLQREKESLESFDKLSNPQTSQVINLLKQMQLLTSSRKQDQFKSHQLKHLLSLKQSQNQKYLTILGQLISPSLVTTLSQNLSKHTKVLQIKYGNQRAGERNQKKRGELETIVGALDREYQDILGDVKGLKEGREGVWRSVEQKEGRKINELEMYERVKEILENKSPTQSNITVIKNTQLQNQKINQLQLQIKSLLSEQANSTTLNTSKVKLLQETSQQFKKFVSDTTDRLRELYKIVFVDRKEKDENEMDIDGLVQRMGEWIRDQKKKLRRVEAEKEEIEQSLRERIKESKNQDVIEDKYHAQIHSLRQERDKAQKRIEELSTKQKQLQQLIPEFHQLSVTSQQIQLHNISLQQQLKQTQTYKQQSIDLSNTISLLQNQLTQKEASILQLNNNMEIQKKIIGSQENQLKLMEMELKERDKAGENRQEEKGERDTMEERIMELIEGGERQKELLEIEQTLNKDLNAEINSLKIQLQQQKKISQLQSQSTQRDELSSRNSQLLNKVQHLQIHLQRVNTQKQQIVEQLQEMKTKKGQHQLRVKQLEKQVIETKENEEEIKELKNESEAMRIQHDRQIQQLRSQNSQQNKLLQTKTLSFSLQLQALKQNQEEQTKSIFSLNQLLSQLQQQNSSLSTKNLSLLSQTTILSQQLLNNQSTIQALQTTHSQLEKLHEQTEFSYNTTKINYEQLIATVKGLCKSVLGVEEGEEGDNLEMSLERIGVLVKELKEGNENMRQRIDRQLIGDQLSDSCIKISAIKKRETPKSQHEQHILSIPHSQPEPHQSNQPHQQNQLHEPTPTVHPIHPLPALYIHQPSFQFPLLSTSQQQIVSPIKYQMVHDEDHEPFIQQQLLKYQENIQSEQTLNKEELSKELRKEEEIEQEEFIIKSTKHLSIDDVRKNSVLDKSDIISNQNKSRIMIQEGKGEEEEIAEEEQEGERMERSEIVEGVDETENTNQNEQQKKQFQEQHIVQQQLAQQNQQFQQQLKQADQNVQPAFDLQPQSKLQPKILQQAQPQSQDKAQSLNFKKQSNLPISQAPQLLIPYPQPEPPIIPQSQFNDVEESESVNSSILEQENDIPNHQEIKKDVELVLTESVLKENELSQSQFENFKEPEMGESMVSIKNEGESKKQMEKIEESGLGNVSVGDFGDVEPDELSKSYIEQEGENIQQQHQKDQHRVQKSSHAIKKSQVLQQPQTINDQHGFQDFKDDTNSELTKSNIHVTTITNTFDDFNDEPPQPLDNSLIEQQPK